MINYFNNLFKGVHLFVVLVLTGILAFIVSIFGWNMDEYINTLNNKNHE